MPLVEKNSQERIVADYKLLQEINQKWRSSKLLDVVEPFDAKMYDVFNLPNSSSRGIVMWSGKYCALLSSNDNENPYNFIEMVMRDMEKGDTIVLFKKSDYEAAKRCDSHIKSKKLKIKFED